MPISANVPISTIMTRDVVQVHPLDTMDKVKVIFQEQGFHHLPVVDSDGQLKGIISQGNLDMLCHNRTIFNRPQEATFNDKFLATVCTKDAMTKHVATLRATDSLGVAAGIFRENLFHALPIVNESNELVGMITTYDLLKYAYQ